MLSSHFAEIFWGVAKRSEPPSPRPPLYIHVGRGADTKSESPEPCVLEEREPPWWGGGAKDITSGGDMEIGKKGPKTNPTHVTFLLSVRSPRSASISWKLLLFDKCGAIKLQVKVHEEEGHPEPAGRPGL